MPEAALISDRGAFDRERDRDRERGGIMGYDSEDTGSEMSEVEESPMIRKNSYNSATEDGIPMYNFSI